MYDCSKLYIQLDVDDFAEEALRTLSGQVTIPAILLTASQDRDAACVMRLVEAAQALGAAALIKDDVALARSSQADGVHLSFSAEHLEHYQAARAQLPADSIVGMSANLSRHTAMIVGEAGADYVAFDGDNNPTGATDPGSDAQSDLVAWWAELFEIPCVALDVDTPERALRLTRAGADFVGLRCRPENGASDLSQYLLSCARQLAGANERVAIDG